MIKTILLETSPAALYQDAAPRMQANQTNEAAGAFDVYMTSNVEAMKIENLGRPPEDQVFNSIPDAPINTSAGAVIENRNENLESIFLNAPSPYAVGAKVARAELVQDNFIRVQKESPRPTEASAAKSGESSKGLGRFIIPALVIVVIGIVIYSLTKKTA